MMDWKNTKKTCNSLNSVQLFVQCLEKVKIQYYPYSPPSSPPPRPSLRISRTAPPSPFLLSPMPTSSLTTTYPQWPSPTSFATTSSSNSSTGSTSAPSSPPASSSPCSFNPLTVPPTTLALWTSLATPYLVSSWSAPPHCTPPPTPPSSPW